MNIIFQQEPDESLRKPWPVVVDEKNSVVSGRPDAIALLGFAAPEEPYIVAILADEVAGNLDEVVGKFPVFIGAAPSGGVFTIDLKVVTCSEYGGDVEALRKMGA